MMEGNSSTTLNSLGEFAAEQAERLLGALAVQVARTARSAGADEVHDLRVAIRRFARGLSALKGCFPRKESAEIRRGLKKLMTRAGAVRDRDVALRLLAGRDSAGASELAKQFRAERKHAARALTLALKRWVRRSSSAKWRNALEGPPPGFRDESVHTAAARILPRLAKDYFRGGRGAARQKAPAEELHRLRIAAKSLRYTLDLFAPAYGGAAAGILDELKGIQTLLGAINDCAVVREMAAQRGGAEEILASLKKRQRRKTAEFRALWGKAVAGGAQERWMETLRHAHAARKPPASSGPAPLVRRASA